LLEPAKVGIRQKFFLPAWHPVKVAGSASPVSPFFGLKYSQIGPTSQSHPNFAFDSLNGGGFIQRIAVVRFAQGRLVVCRKISAVMISENKTTPPGAMVKPPVLVMTTSTSRSS